MIGFPELIAHQPGYGLAWLRAELVPEEDLAGRSIALLSLISAVDPRAWLRRRRHEPNLTAPRSSFTGDDQDPSEWHTSNWMALIGSGEIDVPDPRTDRHGADAILANI